MYIKNFLDWFKLKPRLDSRNYKPPFVEEGNIWWCRLGENVGSEISGKGSEFARPAIVHSKLSKYMYLVIPTTTKVLDTNGQDKQNNKLIKFSQEY
jgi:mRNA interferase MazF